MAEVHWTHDSLVELNQCLKELQGKVQSSQVELKNSKMEVDELLKHCFNLESELKEAQVELHSL